MCRTLYHSEKKSEKIFAETLSTIELKPEECIFIDNTESNLIIPQRMGIHTIWFDDEKGDMKDLREKVAEIERRQK